MWSRSVRGRFWHIQPTGGPCGDGRTSTKQWSMPGETARSSPARTVSYGVASGMLLLLLPATSWAQQRPPIAEQMAKTYGLDSFGQIEGIRYTFNAEFPGVELSRTWENPKTDTVSHEGKDKEGKPVKVTYQRSAVRQPKRCRKDRNRAVIHQRPALVAFPVSRRMGQQCDGDR
jgi:hypothetical protein